MVDVWNIIAGRSLVARANGGLSNHVKDKCRSRADRITLIKAQLFALNTSAKRGTSDETEDTHQSVDNQRIRLEAPDCEGMRSDMHFSDN